MKWELPNVDAYGYLHSFVKECLRDEPETDRREREIAEELWEDPENPFGENEHAIFEEAFEEVIAEHPEYQRALYDDKMDAALEEKIGELRREKRNRELQVILDDEDDNWWIAHEYDPYQGSVVEDAEMGRVPVVSERIAYERELLAAIEESLYRGDFFEVTESLGAIAEEFTVELGEYGEVDNWAQMLIDRRVLSNDQNASTPKEISIVQSVNTLCTSLCHLIAQDFTVLQSIEWRDLERVVLAALAGMKYHVHLTPPAKDGGKDIVASCTLRGEKQTYYIEIKHWRSGKKVGIREVFDFVEVNLVDSTHGGLFLSSSGYSDKVYSQVAELSRKGVVLGGKKKIVTMCQHFVRWRQGIWSPQRPLPSLLFEGAVGSP